MLRIAARLRALGARDVRWLEWPDAPPGGDAADFLDAHGEGEALEELLAAARPFESMPAAQASPGLRFTRLADLLAEPEEKVSWVIEGRLPTGGLSLLAGKPKAGKSTLARCLALAVARGEPWLGFPSQQGLVLYLALEEKRTEVRLHFSAMGATADDPVEVFIAPSPQDGLAQLRQVAEERRPVLIIVDPLIKLVRVRDGNDYPEVTRALEPLLTLARQTGAHVLAVHHLGKGERAGGDAILGSTAFFAAVDTALLLKRGDRYRTLASIQRYGEDLEETVLTLDPKTRWVTAGPSRQEADEAAMGKAILEFLRDQPAPVKEEVIQAAVEGLVSQVVV
jgi:predicted ATP-dependent serine protease